MVVGSERVRTTPPRPGGGVCVGATGRKGTGTANRALPLPRALWSPVPAEATRVCVSPPPGGRTLSAPVCFSTTQSRGRGGHSGWGQRGENTRGHLTGSHRDARPHSPKQGWTPGTGTSPGPCAPTLPQFPHQREGNTQYPPPGPSPPPKPPKAAPPSIPPQWFPHSGPQKLPPLSPSHPAQQPQHPGGDIKDFISKNTPGEGGGGQGDTPPPSQQGGGPGHIVASTPQAVAPPSNPPAPPSNAAPALSSAGITKYLQINKKKKPE